MISKQQKTKFLEELEKTPFVLHASKKVGIDKSTVYRWMNKNEKFKKQVEESLSIGRASLADFAESKLIKKVEEEYFPAIKFVLRHNSPRYFYPRPMTIINTRDKRDVLTEEQKEKLNMLLDGSS